MRRLWSKPPRLFVAFRQFLRCINPQIKVDGRLVVRFFFRLPREEKQAYRFLAPIVDRRRRSMELPDYKKPVYPVSNPDVNAIAGWSPTIPNRFSQRSRDWDGKHLPEPCAPQLCFYTYRVDGTGYPSSHLNVVNHQCAVWFGSSSGVYRTAARRDRATCFGRRLDYRDDYEDA